MRILAIADEESAYLWDFFEKSKLEGIDLIISCGDLAPEYLSFLATFTSAPVLYVHGNHDNKYETHPPEGCICIEDQIYVFSGDPYSGAWRLYALPAGKESVYRRTDAGEGSADCGSSFCAAADSISWSPTRRLIS